ncbi:hypothetical protein J6590_094673 [Homalodisca vitripennis]|nr:hypothetical protein J6590_094673 [Homalodisca vitripennis]
MELLETPLFVSSRTLKVSHHWELIIRFPSIFMIPAFMIFQTVMASISEVLGSEKFYWKVLISKSIRILEYHVLERCKALYLRALLLSLMESLTRHLFEYHAIKRLIVLY